MSLVFTGGSFADGGEHIRRVLRDEGVRAGFFFTGDFYRTPEFAGTIRGLVEDGHYLGPHSDRHLLYCDWNDREKTLVGREEFRADILANFREMERFGVAREKGHLFIPPYEWHNRDIAESSGSSTSSSSTSPRGRPPTPITPHRPCRNTSTRGRSTTASSRTRRRTRPA